VWDKKNGEYVPEGESGDVHCVLYRDGTLECGVAYDDGYAGGIDWVKTEDAVVEQCTGLTDKHGKLIYAGDVFEAIVLNSCDCDENIGKRIRGQVAYFTDSACFTFAAYSPINLGQIEIIGNIHEMEVEK
jgi:hypothetical protein